MPLERTVVTNSQLKSAINEPNFGNDYNSYYHVSGVLPQEHITNQEDPYRGYPKLQKLHELKKKHQEKYASPVVGYRCTPDNMGPTLKSWVSSRVQFDVIMVGGCATEFSKENLAQLPLDKLGPRPSLLFLWVPSWKLDDGRELLEKWGYRRSEDIVFATKSADSIYSPPRTQATCGLVFTTTTWHCFMGLKGTLRRSDDSHLINCNVDTDVILETVRSRPNIVPEQIYEVIERFTSMNRKIHIVPFHSPEQLPVRLRPGWVMVTPDTMLSNFEMSEYMARSCIPVEASIDNLRPKTPRK